MSTITYEYRWTHPTTADVSGRLDVSHCHRCEAWGTDIQAWLTAPNTAQGKVQLDAIGEHVLAEYPRPTTYIHHTPYMGVRSDKEESQ